MPNEKAGFQRSLKTCRPRPMKPEEAEETLVQQGDPAGFDWHSELAKVEGKSGAELIQELVKRLPNSAGVYRMMNAAGDVLYVGKARSLKKRVTSYAQGPRPFQPADPHGARNGGDGVRHHPHRSRSAASGSQSYQAFAPAL